MTREEVLDWAEEHQNASFPIKGLAINGYPLFGDSYVATVHFHGFGDHLALRFDTDIGMLWIPADSLPNPTLARVFYRS